MTAPQDENREPPLPPAALFLKRLVLAMAVVMIAAFLAVLAVAVRILMTGPAALPLPSEIVLPTGTEAVAVTTGSDWYAIVTADDRILIYDRASGQLRQTVEITR